MIRRRLPLLLAVSLVLLLAGRWNLAAQQPVESSSQQTNTETQPTEEPAAENQPPEGESEAVESGAEQPEEAAPAEAGAAEGETEASPPGEEAAGSSAAPPDSPPGEEPSASPTPEGNESTSQAATELEEGETPTEEEAEEPTEEPAEPTAAGEEGAERSRDPGAEGEEPGAEAEPEAEAPPQRTTAEGAAATPEEKLSPEEQARLEEMKRKREAIAAKRAEKKAREAEKREQKQLAVEAKQAERLDVVLAKGYEALYAGKLEAARQAFEKHMELDGGDSYGGHLGLARIELARDNQAAAIEQALKAVKATTEGAEKAEALTFAAETTLAARPRDEASGTPLPGTESFRDNALRYYMQALVADPEGASEARAALEEAFPTPEDERTERFYDRYVESSEAAPLQYAKRLAATYEALLSGQIGGPLAVVGGITAPEKTSGSRPPYPQNPAAENIRRRLVIGLIVEPDGTVSNARVLNGIDAKLDRAAETAMRQWTFEPAHLPSGAPVEVYYVVVTNADVEPLEPLAAEETTAETAEETAGRGAPGREPTSERTSSEQEATGRESSRGERRGEAETGETLTEPATERTEASEEIPPEDSSPQAGEAPPEPEREDDQ